MISSTGILTINLSAIESNWRYVSASLRADAVCAAVVKANAYGVGVSAVATALYHAGCRYFYVVTLHEAAELRGAVPADVTVYVLGGVPDAMEQKFVELNLVPVLYSSETFERWLSFCSAQQRAFPCALKFNTGMTRLGLDGLEFTSLLNKDLQYLNPVLAMSHLACADEPSHPLNGQQLQRFSLIVEKIKALYPHIKASLANSSGTFLGDTYHFDMVRIGAALYGINPQFGNPNPLNQVFHLKLPVLQIRTTEQDESVGYGASACVAKGTRLAVVAGGYADGVHRSLGLTPVGQAHGKEVKSVGRMSMDSFIFDISHVPGNPAYIDVINDDLTLDYLMSANKTLGYEVLTSLGDRYQRRYIFSENNNE